MTIDRLKILLADYLIIVTELREENAKLVNENKKLITQFEKDKDKK